MVACAIIYFKYSQRASLVIGALTLSIIFGVINPGFVWAFLTGLAVVYIHYQRGLDLAMTVHLSQLVTFKLPAHMFWLQNIIACCNDCLRNWRASS